MASLRLIYTTLLFHLMTMGNNMSSGRLYSKTLPNHYTVLNKAINFDIFYDYARHYLCEMLLSVIFLIAKLGILFNSVVMYSISQLFFMQNSFTASITPYLTSPFQLPKI